LESEKDFSETIHVNCSAPGMTLLSNMAYNQEAPDLKPSWGLATLILCGFVQSFYANASIIP
jgi:hypothetical protein